MNQTYLVEKINGVSMYLSSKASSLDSRLDHIDFKFPNITHCGIQNPIEIFLFHDIMVDQMNFPYPVSE